MLFPPFDENTPFLDMLTSLLIEENGFLESNAVRLIASYPHIVIQGVLRGRTSTRATTKALIRMEALHSSLIAQLKRLMPVDAEVGVKRRSDRLKDDAGAFAAGEFGSGVA